MCNIFYFYINCLCSFAHQEKQRLFAYTGCQLNSASAAIKFFNMAILCELEQEPLVVESMKKCFDSVEVAHGYNKSIKLGKC